MSRACLPRPSFGSGQVKHTRLISSVGNGALSSGGIKEVRTEDKLSCMQSCRHTLWLLSSCLLGCQHIVQVSKIIISITGAASIRAMHHTDEAISPPEGASRQNFRDSDRTWVDGSEATSKLTVLCTPKQLRDTTSVGLCSWRLNGD